MRYKYKGSTFLIILFACMLALAACSAPGQANMLTPAQTLQNSAQAMSKLQSVHFDIQASLMAQIGTASTVPGTPTTNSSSFTFNITGRGDAETPDQASINLSLANKPIVNIISKGQMVFVQTRDGKWFSIDKSHVKNGPQSFFSKSMAKRLADLTTLLKNAKLTDLGQETVNGESLDHINIVLDQQTLQAVSSQINGLLPSDQQQAQNLLTKGIVDLWVDPKTSYIHQAKLDVVAQVDISKMPLPLGQGQANNPLMSTIELKAQLNFSKFNQPVNIQAPAGAVPLPQ